MRSREGLFMSVFERGNMSDLMRLTLIVLIIASQTIASSTNPLRSGPGYQTRMNRILRRVMMEGKKRLGEK